MIRRPPRSTRTDTLFPYTTLFRALIDSLCAKARILPVITIAREQDILPLADALAAGGLTALEVTLRSQYGLKAIQVLREQRPELVTGAGTVLDRHMLAAAEAAGSQFIVTPGIRSEERRVGTECGSTCSSRWSP